MFSFTYDAYSWRDSSSQNLVALFQLRNSYGTPQLTSNLCSYNYTASLTIPERIQVGYSFFSVPQFAFGNLYSGDRTERVPAQCYAPPEGQNYTYWAVYERFTEASVLTHKISVGYGLLPRADLSTITLGTGAGIILLSFCVMGLILWGKKIENSRYGRRFEQLTQY